MASRARWAALLSYFLFQCLGIGLIFLLQRVHRAPLPHEEIAALAASVATGQVPWPGLTIELSSPAGGLPAGQLQELQRQLEPLLAQDGARLTLAAAPPRELPSACLAGESGACLEGLAEGQEAGASAALAGSGFWISAVAAADCSQLLLDAGRGAVLRWRKGATAEELAKKLAGRLRETWLKPARLEATASLFEVAPAYVFSFFLVGDCRQRVAWDFPGEVLEPFLGRFLARLGLLVDFEIDSQVVHCGALTSSGEKRIDPAALSADFLSNAGEWPGDAVTRARPWLPPLVRLVAFKHSGDVQVVDVDEQQQRSFAVQGWGAVAMTSEADAACAGRNASAEGLALLQPCEAQQVASAWVSHLRSWLALPPDASVPEEEGSCSGDGLGLQAVRPSLDGIAAWELRRVAQALHAHFVQRTAETLENLRDLVDSLPDVVVVSEIGEMAFQAAAAAKKAYSAAEEGDLVAALSAARQGLALALTAQQDDTVVAQMYFSWEFKYAVYLPLGLPLLVPVLVSLNRQVRHARKLRRLKSAPPAKGEEHVE